MSLEDAIKEVAKAIQSHADAIREDIAQRNVDNEALRCLMRVEYEDDEEPAPVVSLAEKRKEKADAAPLTVYADTKKAKTAESEYLPGFNPNDEPIRHEFKGANDPGAAVEQYAPGVYMTLNPDDLPLTTPNRAETMAALNVPDVAEVQKALDESLTEEYVIECFRKAMMPKPGVSQQENKDNVREILKKYGCVGPLLKDGKVSIKPEKWQDFTRELLS